MIQPKDVEKEKVIAEVLAMQEEEDDEANRSCEEVDSDELDGEMNLSDCEDEAMNFRGALKQKKGGKQRRKYRQEIDTNIFKI
jgi:hypothetical protein